MKCPVQGNEASLPKLQDVGWKDNDSLIAELMCGGEGALASTVIIQLLSVPRMAYSLH